MNYPFTPGDLLDTIERHAQNHDRHADRITVGMPGMIRGGEVVFTPHYIRGDGPHTDVSTELSAKWKGCEIQSLIQERFGKPALVLNDAQVAAAGVVRGEGAELVITLGTGLGCALVVDGALTPHLEISHALAFDNLTYDQLVGQVARDGADPVQWSADVLRAIDSLHAVYHWDQLYIGGGNSFKLTPEVRGQLKERGVVFLEYEAGASGGARAWDLAK